MGTSDFPGRLLPRPGRGDLLVVAAIVIWSVNVVVVKVALQVSGPLTYSALRYIVGGIALLLLARFLEGPVRLPLRGDRWLLVALAASGVLVNQSSFTGALALTNADNVAMIAATTPVLVTIWLAWRSRERFRGLVWVGLGLGLLGLGLVVEAGHWSGLLGIGVALLNPIAWAGYLILLPRLLGRYCPLTLAALITVLGAMMLVPLGVVQTVVGPPHPSLVWLGLLAYSSLGAVALTTWMYLPGVSRLGPARTAIYSYLQPFLAVLAAGLLIGEAVLPLQLLGGAVMLIGVAIGRPRARPTPARAPILATGAGSQARSGQLPP
ncbi:MAG TPA: DMT family transporter [Candidatus Acidoferrales bacterium]|nr:DMT family transporter [Candidatus Acidoferrales bacterium]